MEERLFQSEFEDASYYFQGSYVRSVDEKGRFNLPFRFRRSGGAAGDEKFVLALGPDKVLCLMPHTEWLRAFQRMRRKGLNEKSRRELRRQSHNSEVLTPDSQGRITVSPEILAHHGIGEKIRVLGMGHYLELWDPAKHSAHHKALPDPDPEFMNELFA